MFLVPPLALADHGQSLDESQMVISLSLPWGDRKTRLRLPPPQPAVAKSWHCQEDRERKEDRVWPSLRVPQRNCLHLLIWAKSDSKQISLFPFILYCMWSQYAPGTQPVFIKIQNIHICIQCVYNTSCIETSWIDCVWHCGTLKRVFFFVLFSCWGVSSFSDSAL